jgi:hypothetical protein
MTAPTRRIGTNLRQDPAATSRRYCTKGHLDNHKGHLDNYRMSRNPATETIAAWDRRSWSRQDASGRSATEQGSP